MSPPKSPPKSPLKPMKHNCKTEKLIEQNLIEE